MAALSTSVVLVSWDAFRLSDCHGTADPRSSHSFAIRSSLVNFSVKVSGCTISKYETYRVYSIARKSRLFGLCYAMCKGGQCFKQSRQKLVCGAMMAARESTYILLLITYILNMCFFENICNSQAVRRKIDGSSLTKWSRHRSWMQGLPPLFP